MRKLLAIAALVLASGCYKDDLEGLDYNPFDPEYTGPVMFTLEEDFITLLQNPNGTQNRRLTQRVRVHTEHFLGLTTYVVEAVPQNGGATVEVPGNEVQNGLFDLNTDNTESGTTYCWEVRLTNHGGAGARNSVCSTTD
mgnify:CR=1 FL=1|jgi:hypothetical protein